MQKKLIVLALAGLASSAAFAQTNVTIYGVIDEYVGYGSSNNSCTTAIGGSTCISNGNVSAGGRVSGDQKQYGLYSGGLSGSRLGFKGEEALGNGLKAIFVYEFGNLDPSTQNNNIGQSRNSYVGLSGGFGTVVAGRLNSPGYSFAEAYNPMPGAVFSSQQNISGNNGMTIVAGNAGRLNNTLAYLSPNFSGFSGKIAYAFGEQTTGTNATGPGNFDSAQGIWGLGLDYANGPLAVGLAYHNISNVGGTLNGVGVSDKDQWELAIGGSYDFKIVKLFASWQNLNQDNFRTTLTSTNSQVLTPLSGNGSLDGNLWNIAARIPVGANGAVNLAYSQYYNNISGPSNDQRVSNYGIDYEYSFSKRTTAYVGYNYMDNGSNTAYGYGATTANVVPTADSSAWLLGAGLRHTF